MLELYPHQKEAKVVIEIEEWRDVAGCEGYYQVSSLGRIKSVERVITCSKYIRKYPGRILKFAIDRNGYCRCSFGLNQKTKTYKLHRLVAEAFIPNPNNLPQVNHIDGNKQNNQVDNLEWCSNSQNIQHAYDNKLLIGNKCEDNPSHKLTTEQVEEIRKLYKPRTKEFSTVALAKKYDVHRKTISRILTNKTWRG